MNKLSLILLAVEITLLMTVVISSHVINLPLYTIGVGFFVSAFIVRIEVSLQAVQRMEAGRLALNLSSVSKSATLTVPAGFMFDGKDF